MGMKSREEELKKFIRNHGVYQWEVAHAVGVCETTFIRWLREEWCEEKRDCFKKIVLEIQKRKIADEDIGGLEKGFLADMAK